MDYSIPVKEPNCRCKSHHGVETMKNVSRSDYVKFLIDNSRKLQFLHSMNFEKQSDFEELRVWLEKQKIKDDDWLQRKIKQTSSMTMKQILNFVKTQMFDDYNPDTHDESQENWINKRSNLCCAKFDLETVKSQWLSDDNKN